ncbi:MULTISPECIES: C39 family peptidase [Streptomyces]|uniref:C39 family peptidase n=1 Tax=Streptomyces TaxID=1883 RepID=UPI00163BCCF2|nr:MULTISPECIES: C39 family peptidase [Streptomyces]MBC2876448.1 C39 family peptidase [Streptomyces sp. TYQ1024]UBI40879.1 C39 family peptidase [Streptomyces mobaraensis]
MKDTLTTLRPAPVPYFAQWASAHLVEDIVTGRIRASEDPAWAQYGASDPEEYAWWSWRLCGIACLRMALAHFGRTPPKAMELAAECTAAGGYVKHADGLHGLIHAPFASWVRDRFGLAAEARPELSAADLPGILAAGGLAILSVHPSIRHPDSEPPAKGGHLVLAVGATEHCLLIHNPSGFPGTSQRDFPVPWDRLGRFYARRGIILAPPPPTTDPA